MMKDGMQLSDCNTLFIKQVLPKFLKPTIPGGFLIPVGRRKIIVIIVKILISNIAIRKGTFFNFSFTFHMTYPIHLLVSNACNNDLNCIYHYHDYCNS